MIQFQTTH